jgi:AAA domain
LTKKPNVHRKRPQLSERFEFVGDDATASGDPAILRPSVFPVYDRMAQIDRGLRIWRKTGSPIDADLRELWLHEMRQVRRLMASAGASEVIVDLIEMVEDDQSFGIVVEDSGQSLSLMRSRAGQSHWLRNLRAGRSRALLWSNVRRLARALGLVHGQGLVHGTLSADAVMTHGALDPDFRLTGFEWSLWFAAPANVPSQPDLPAAAIYRQQAYSFAADWCALGELVANLLDVRLSPTGEVKASKAGIDVELSTPEAMLLRRLVYPGAAEALDGSTVMRSIDDIIVEIARAGAVRTGTFILLIPDSCGLAKAAAQATGNAIESDQRRLQLEWAAADVAVGATLFVQPKTPGVTERLTLVTDTMSYVLKAFTELSGETSWDIAFCESASLRESEVVRGRRGTAHELVQPITFLPSHREARDTRARLGASVLDWSVFGGPASTDVVDSRRDVRRALTLVQAVEAFTKAMEILPVEAAVIDRENGRRIATLRAREDGRDAIAVPIGLAATDASLRRLFDEDGRQGDGNWLIGVSNRLDSGRSADVAATFLDVIEAKGTTGYRFELDDNLPTSAPLFLRSKQDQGTGAVIRRRLRNIAAMADQPAVADMLDDPWLIRRTSRDLLIEDARFRELDRPKQEAMQRIWSTLPLFAVVGPPGVGKTRLAREVVARRFEDEPSARLLLTAQGHHALDHLQDEVIEALVAIGRPDALIVRTTVERKSEVDSSRFQDGDEPEYDATRLKVTEMLTALSRSELAASLPPPVRARLTAHAKSAAVEDRDTEKRRSYQASANLLLDAANVVVSTTNSAAIGRMVSERATFDLVIVEEAAKATGPELVGALGLSGRQLLIGDHRQLPPFDADRIEKILSNDELVRKVIDGAPDVIGSFFADGELADLQEAVRDAASFEKLKGLAVRMVQPFRAIVEGDERRVVPGGPSRRLSAVLTEQRRMNPAISEIVSQAFYGGKLTTSAGTAADSPIECLAPLPASPVVIVDFQHVSRTGRSSPAEFRVRGFHNPGEVDAVMRVLQLLRASSGVPEPTVAILSPYREQVSRIRERFDAMRGQGLLPNFEQFRPVRDAVGFVGTVDSFQGSEADVVIVSMVRNNSRTGRSGLGFLSDPRRMNVLLSRAKSKLVLVGSMRFLREAVRGIDPGGEKDDLRFLMTMLEVVERLVKQHSGDGTPLATIIRPSTLGADT